MRAKTKYEKGNHKMFCWVCGFVEKRSRMKLRWDNVWACKECWDRRHPNDRPPAPRFDGRAVKKPQLEPADKYLGLTEVTESNFDS